MLSCLCVRIIVSLTMKEENIVHFTQLFLYEFLTFCHIDDDMTSCSIIGTLFSYTCIVSKISSLRTKLSIFFSR